ncbi:MAG TPA: VOC family protein [Terriglobales bacterium]|nr:VOC family protein [Terriglobales bacterium]
MSANASSITERNRRGPVLMVTNMDRLLAFFIDGLGFTIQNRWIPDGRLRWCWMTLGGATIMLQEATETTREKLLASAKLGNGVGLNFQCGDALAIYYEAVARGVRALREPQVGKSSWEVVFADPDGYKIPLCKPYRAA